MFAIIIATGFVVPESIKFEESLLSKIETGLTANVSEAVLDLRSKLSEEETIADILFVGDIMLGRNVERLMEEKGGNFPFEKVSDLLTGSDITVGNLEGAITESHTPTPNGSFRISFSPKIVASLDVNGFDFVSLANNHATDNGSSLFSQSKKLLGTGGVIPFGEPYSIAKPVLVNINGQEVAFFGYNFTHGGLDKKKIFSDIADFRDKNSNFYIIVVPHWGDEYKLVANDIQKEIAHGLIDFGANVIIGGHPHVVQNIELYKGKPIFYSLGNFIFDQYFSLDVQKGLVVNINLSDSDVSYKLLPVISERSEPKLMNDEEKAGFLSGLAGRSDSLLETSIRDGVLLLSR